MKTIIFSIFVIFLLNGCSAKNIVTPDAKNIRIYDRLPTNINCEYIDEIIGSEANVITFFFISNKDITAGARADLRNQAARLGGNTVEVQTADFMYTTSTTFIGHVYTCNPK